MVLEACILIVEGVMDRGVANSGTAFDICPYTPSVPSAVPSVRNCLLPLHSASWLAVVLGLGIVTN